MQDKMKVFTATFYGLFSIGTATIVEESKQKAYKKLKKELDLRGIKKSFTIEDLHEVNTTLSQCIILNGS